MNPLAKWNRDVGRSRIVAKTVKALPVSDHFPAVEADDERTKLSE
jgi:hypothetical protein